jgi:RNA-directed DNA polymerase
MNHETPSEQVPAMDKPTEADLWHCHQASRGVWTEPMLRTLEKGPKGNKWHSLIDKIWSERTLEIAWEKVASNAGTCGVDSITVDYFGKDSQKRLLAIKEQLTKQTYQPQAIKRVWIPKPGSSEERPLGIPTVKDRVVQTALKMVIEPIFEMQFAPTSYGFRPGCDCKAALREVERLLHSGYIHVVDVDIKGYFDAIPHAPLMQLVKEHIADGRVLDLIEAFLKQGEMSEGDEIKSQQGSPQGGVISPLLANIYLNPLDWLLNKLGYQSARYADDLVILTKSAEEAQQAMTELEQWMGQAQLTLHPIKTRIVDMNAPRASFDFLGYRFLRTKGGKLLRLVRDKSKKKLRESIKVHTKRANGKSLSGIIEQLNPILRGWFNYFKQAHISEHAELSAWVRMRLRSILRKRAGGRGRGRGLDHKKWSNDYFDRCGLFNLEAARIEALSLRRGAKC